MEGLRWERCRCGFGVCEIQCPPLTTTRSPGDGGRTGAGWECSSPPVRRCSGGGPFQRLPGGAVWAAGSGRWEEALRKLKCCDEKRNWRLRRVRWCFRDILPVPQWKLEKNMGNDGVSQPSSAAWVVWNTGMQAESNGCKHHLINRGASFLSGTIAPEITRKSSFHILKNDNPQPLSAMRWIQMWNYFYWVHCSVVLILGYQNDNLELEKDHMITIIKFIGGVLRGGCWNWLSDLIPQNEKAKRVSTLCQSSY